MIKKEKKEVLRWYFSKEPQITESIKRLLVVDDDGREYLPYDKLENINVVNGGSPFTYTYEYDYRNDRWYVDKSSKGSYYLSENNDENEYGLEELYNFIIDNLNWKGIGMKLKSRCESKWRNTIFSKFSRNKKFLVDWEWILIQLDDLTNSDVCIIFSDEDLYTISSII